jgi:ABC-type thiamine transport system ATPase subunit
MELFNWKKTGVWVAKCVSLPAPIRGLLTPRKLARASSAINAVAILSPKESQNLGITVIYQDFNLVPHLSIARNIFLGHESQMGSRIILNHGRMNHKSKELLSSLGIDLDPKLPGRQVFAQAGVRLFAILSKQR